MSILLPCLISLITAVTNVSTENNVVCPQGEKRCAVRYLFRGIVDSDTVSPAVQFIEQANEAGADEIILEINTPGGSVGDGFVLARAIEESDTPVTCVVDGAAESMGAYILMSCDKRLMTRRSLLMFHEPSLSGQMNGHWEDWQSIADMMEAERKAIAEHCQGRLKVSMEEYKRRTNGALMWFMTWRDAVRYGAIDGIVKNAKSEYKRALRHK